MFGDAIVPSLLQQVLHCCADAVAKLEYCIHVAFLTWQFAVISKRKGQQCLLMSERLLCSCDGFCGASEQEAGAHVTCRLADGNLERIRRLFSNRPCHGFDAILTSKQTCEKLQCLCKNLMSNNFRKTAVLKKISIVN